MKLKEFIKVGRITKSQGLDGALKIILDHPFGNIYEYFDHLFVQHNGQMLPYFIEEVETDGSGHLYILFEEIQSPQEASVLTGKDVYQDEARIAATDIYSLAAETAPDLHSITGYTLTDDALPAPALIKEVNEFPGQLMATLILGDREQFLPLEKTFIKKIDYKNRQIFTAYPEGMFDL